jgi:hypothetical protein
VLTRTDLYLTIEGDQRTRHSRGNRGINRVSAAQPELARQGTSRGCQILIEGMPSVRVEFAISCSNRLA